MDDQCARAPGNCEEIDDETGHWHIVPGQSVYGDRYAVAVNDRDEIVVDRRPDHMQ